MSVTEAKAKLRASAKSARADAVCADAPAHLSAHLLARYAEFAPGSVVSGYLAIGDELDVAPALNAVRARGLRTALPVVVAPEAPLVFRQWQSGDPLDDGPLHTRHPSPDAPQLEPDVLLIPMLAFDGGGYRIGWGGGFYDRTLEVLRRRKPIQAVGIAYAAQRVDKVPRDHHDARLDAIATEVAYTEVPETL